MDFVKLKSGYLDGLRDFLKLLTIEIELSGLKVLEKPLLLKNRKLNSIRLLLKDTSRHSLLAFWANL